MGRKGKKVKPAWKPFAALTADSKKGFMLTWLLRYGAPGNIYTVDSSLSDSSIYISLQFTFVATLHS